MFKCWVQEVDNLGRKKKLMVLLKLKFESFKMKSEDFFYIGGVFINFFL